MATFAVERVGHMEDEARLHVAPDDAGPVAVPRQQAHAGVVGRVPAEREQVAAEHGAHREGDGQIEHDGEPRGEGAIVDAGAVLDGDRHVADHLAVCRDDDVADGIPDAAVIGNRMVLAREGIAVRVPAERTTERAVERVVALLLQGLRKLDGKLPASTRAKARPPMSATLVFTVSLRPRRGPGAAAWPSAAAARRERIQRLRYHRAFPSRMAMPCTIPSPRNQ